jgi:hypothetical protein
MQPSIYPSIHSSRAGTTTQEKQTVPWGHTILRAVHSTNLFLLNGNSLLLTLCSHRDH